MSRLLAIAGKELKHIARDRRTLFAVLGMPLLQLLLFAYALSFDVRDIPTLVIDQDLSPASREFLASFSHSGFFDVVGTLASVREADGAFEADAARVVIVVPPRFGERLAEGRRPAVGVLVDGSEPNAATLARTYATAISQLYSGGLASSRAEALGVAASPSTVRSHLRIWYNPEARSAAYLVPGLIVVIIMIVMTQQTATTLVRERDYGTLEQLMVSPMRRAEMVVGKVLPWVGIAAADIVVITLVAVFALGIPFRGDLVLYAVASALFVLCCLAFGILVSSRAGSVEVANQTALILSFLPGFMLSGFVFPLGSIPPFLRFVSYLFPARYMVVITRAAFLKGAGWAVLWPQVGALAIYAAVALTLASVAVRGRE